MCQTGLVVSDLDDLKVLHDALIAQENELSKKRGSSGYAQIEKRLRNLRMRTRTAISVVESSERSNA